MNTKPVALSNNQLPSELVVELAPVLPKEQPVKAQDTRALRVAIAVAGFFALAAGAAILVAYDLSESLGTCPVNQAEFMKFHGTVLKKFHDGMYDVPAMRHVNLGFKELQVFDVPYVCANLRSFYEKIKEDLLLNRCDSSPTQLCVDIGRRLRDDYDAINADCEKRRP